MRISRASVASTSHSQDNNEPEGFDHQEPRHDRLVRTPYIASSRSRDGLGERLPFRPASAAHGSQPRVWPLQGPTP